jgi:signal transduction histidine kinase
MMPDIPGLADHTQKAFALFQLSTLGFFFGWLFRFSLHLPRVNRLNNVVAWALFVYGLLVATGRVPYAGRVVVLVGICLLVAIESLAIWLVLRGRRELLLYLSAFTAFLLSGILLMVRALGWVGNHMIIDYLPLLTSSIHMVLINVGLAQRARRAEHARRTADQVTISTSLQNERDLERRVIERTHALERANAALLMEVAEREELQAQLRLALAKEREALAVQRQFVSMVSHEFRTPLAIIDATAQRIMLQHATEAATLSPPMQKIRRGVQRLTNLIDTFLGEERMPAQGEAVVSERLDLTVLARTCAEQHLPLSSGLIHCLPPDQPVLVEGDPGMLTLVLSNLVDNALKYSPPGHPVTLQIGHDDKRGWIDVIDYGVGIPPEEHEHVFGKHVRLGVVVGVGGTGLGLHIARNAARRMGGDIELESEAGKGSCFRLWLPLAGMPASSPAAQTSA